MAASGVSRAGSRVRRTAPVASHREKPGGPAAEGRGKAQPPAGAARSAAGANRPLALLMIMVLVAAALGSRLVFWQVMQHGHLYSVALAQREALLSQPAVRGEILDANGTPFAVDVPLDAVYAVPKQMQDPQGTADVLAPILGRSADALKRIFAAYSGYALLEPQVSQAVSARLKALHLPGLVLVPQMRRDYPESTVASQVLGYVDGNERGQYGVEEYYDRLLSGKAGLASVLKDTAGNEIHFSSSSPVSTQDGAILQLSLDGAVQSLVERALQKAVRQHSADGGTIIVMDPRTGYILGLAGSPAYDPNQYARADPAHFTNPATQWTYEPGSTFKVVTMAAGLDSHAITPGTAFDDIGKWVVGDVTIHNWSNSGFGWETMTQVLQHSANVGASFVASRLGTQRFYDYVKRFGFGHITGVDLAGEWAGRVPQPGDRDWTIVNKYTNSYGQGLSVTPLQMLQAVSAVANGGIMMRPQIVQRLTYQGRTIDHPPVSEGRVISAQAAGTLTHMLVQSAIHGEAQRALIKGYDIAAKTGTANVPAPGGGYLRGVTVASIVGYAPASSPRLAALVVLNHPRDTLWGSIAAAPVLRELFQELFMYYHIPPSSTALNQ